MAVLLDPKHFSQYSTIWQIFTCYEEFQDSSQCGHAELLHAFYFPQHLISQWTIGLQFHMDQYFHPILLGDLV